MSKEDRQKRKGEAQGKDKPKYREIPPDQLKEILEEHRKWIESQGKEGKRGNLDRIDLQGVNLERVNLERASLEGANLSHAQLQEANLTNANLKRALLRSSNIQRARIYNANLLAADLSEADLQEADLLSANLNVAELNKANLQDANLSLSSFEKASLHLANLQGAKLTEAKFKGARLSKTKLRDADLQDADLTNVVGLLAGQLAGANVSGATLPQDIHKFEGLKIVEEASKNARKLFLSMLLFCVYCWLTIATTTDARLLTNSASSPLPIIGTAIPMLVST